MTSSGDLAPRALLGPAVAFLFYPIRTGHGANRRPSDQEFGCGLSHVLRFSGPFALG